ncbi:uncharacterized protein LOC112889113 [Panicum hallii]|uniref:uncharacterized protein LOC112889113 n=1 Tax=Panicum hallii TaxID=206008 RepID=UPI000DF4CA64|nr:uncharacterized protein LOC112889113 [Panicum hallii]
MADNGRATTPSAAMHATSTLLSPVVGLDFTGEQVYLDDLLSSRILAQEFISADRLMKRFCQLPTGFIEVHIDFVGLVLPIKDIVKGKVKIHDHRVSDHLIFNSTNFTCTKSNWSHGSFPFVASPSSDCFHQKN